MVSATVGAQGSLSADQRKHRRAHDGKEEDSHGKSECNYPHATLLKLSSRVGEEKHCGEQHRVGEILAGNAAGRARLLLTVSSLRGRFGGFARPGCYVEFGHKGILDPHLDSQKASVPATRHKPCAIRGESVRRKNS